MKNRIKGRCKEQFLNPLQTIISYPSVSTKAKWNTVWDKPSRCLEKTLKFRLQEMGFLKLTQNPEGYYGYAEIGQGKNPGQILVTWMLFQPVI